MIDIDEKHFIEVCNNSPSMARAAQELGIHFNTFVRYAKKLNCYKPNPGLKGFKKNPTTKIKTIDILEGRYPQYQTFKLKNRILKEHIKEHKCECCGLTTWMNEPIPLELHHIDGNRTNHKLENLKLLCPNCHAQTETYRAKNIK